MMVLLGNPNALCWCYRTNVFNVALLFITLKHLLGDSRGFETAWPLFSSAIVFLLSQCAQPAQASRKKLKRMNRNRASLEWTLYWHKWQSWRWRNETTWNNCTYHRRSMYLPQAIFVILVYGRFALLPVVYSKVKLDNFLTRA